MSENETIINARNYISTLEIPPVDNSLPDLYQASAPVFQSETKGAAVDKGSLVSFVSGLSDTHKKDVLNSTLLAQLAADKKFNRFTATREWYTFYRTVLENVGWVVPSFAYRDYRPGGSSLVVSDAILEILSAIATGDEMKILRTTLESLKENPKNEKSLTLFDQQSFPDNVGTFQILPVGEDDGQVVMALAAMEFKSQRHVTRFLWFKWESVSTKLFQSAQKCVLNEEVYSRVRQDVIEKLGGNAQKFVHDIDI